MVIFMVSRFHLGKILLKDRANVIIFTGAVY